MKVLLIYAQFPKNFWSFEKALAIVEKKSLQPPLGLITVASLLPREWELKLVDRNIQEISESDWQWADLVMISGMLAQKKDMLAQVHEAKKHEKIVVAGGPYPTSLPDECLKAGVDFLVLDEGEITVPLFIEALEKGEKSGIFRDSGIKPDLITSPIPRFDLLDMDAYGMMSVQYSRGCPHQCEFCDIITLFGRKPRNKTPQQFISELQCLYDMGCRQSIFIVDDNFIGNKRKAMLLLDALQPWMEDHGYPFSFTTEASLELSQDQKLMDKMVKCNFGAVFIGIETPDEESLNLTKKFQNTRYSLIDSVNRIQNSGLRVMAGFIIGFDCEKAGAGDRIVKFVEQTSIPIVFYSTLQALPHTALWNRLEKENRLLKNSNADMDSGTLMNFIPTRPIEEIALEFVESFNQLYDPARFIDRTYHCYCILSKVKFPKKKIAPKKMKKNVMIKGILIVFWKLGVVYNSRWKFWINLLRIYKNNPKGLMSYLNTCGHIEHFYLFRKVVKDQIENQLKDKKIN
ncbi:radical SAM protein [Candidatus Magnetomorum sp. HK-1]|nr:radical SAM protein [Candidatus Magnetomorum sp. HK-1]